MEDFIVEDLFENRARVGIVRDEITVDREAARGGSFRDVQEGEQTMVRLVLDGQIVETMPAGKRRSVEQCLQTAGSHAEKRGATLAKEIAVVQLVDRVLEIETAEERVGCNLSRAQNVAPAIGFECQQLADAPVEIAPHPPVNRAEHPIQRRDVGDRCHIDSRTGE
jgi:hypothetical protein